VGRRSAAPAAVAVASRAGASGAAVASSSSGTSAAYAAREPAHRRLPSDAAALASDHRCCDDARVIERTTVAPGLTLDITAPDAVPAPAVIVVHEAWGLTDDIRDLCRRLAAAGFLAAAPDLYRGALPADLARARELARGLDLGRAMADLAAVVRHLAADPRAGAVGIVGFCLGGGVALAAAGHVEGLAAAAPFYGLPPPPWLAPERVRVPVQGHYAARDHAVPSEQVRTAFHALVGAGVDVELCMYDAGHAFMRRGGEHHDESAATAAWSRMVAFLRRHLASA
jgi:carboxymethylenebutenolidase